MNESLSDRIDTSSSFGGAAIQAGMDRLCGEEGRSTSSQVSNGLCGTTATAQGSDALAKQVGGEHYKSLAIQPVEFIVKNGIPFLEANAIKYLVRHNSKGGAADIRKAIHYCELLLALQYGEKA